MSTLEQPPKTYGLDYWHPHFRWMPWEPGDTTYPTREVAEHAAAIEKAMGARVRVVPTY